ncbi:MAG: hypothetical protein KGI25_03595 [Thaumarchaeota archaeon]|nr:hypothetical protein [Nitrososphaerota archaeon]
MGVKSVLGQASRYSDGGLIGGQWYTLQDKALTIKHTEGSVKYNAFEHADDHMAEAVAQLGKLYNADRGKAETLAKELCNLIDKWYSAVEEFKKVD